MSVAIVFGDPALSVNGDIAQPVTIHDALSGRELGRLLLITDEHTGATSLFTRHGQPFPPEMTREEIVTATIQPSGAQTAHPEDAISLEVAA